MPYVSEINPKAVVIDDKTPEREYRIRSFGMGFMSRPPEAYLSDGFATPFPLPVIPRSEWRDRIEERERTGAKLRDVKEWAGFKSLNQGQTPYCWVNAPTQAMHYIRAIHGFPHVPLSPASVGAKVKNFRAVGGWGSEALAYMLEHGIAPQEDWPANAIDRRYDDEQSKASRKLYFALEYWELKPRNLDELVSCLLHGIPVAVGYNWWGHEVLANDPVALDGSDRWAIEIDNSWGSNWSDNGHGLLEGSKMLPDEAVAVRVTTAYVGDDE